MKQNSLSVILCLLLLQPSLHANPFQTGAARIAAAMYWACVSIPGIVAVGFASQRPMIRKEIQKLDENGNPIFPDLKNYDPVKYAQAKALLLHGGIANIDDYTIKVITDAGLEKEPQWKNNLDSPFSVGKNVIVFHDVTIPADGSLQHKNALSNLDSTSLAAVLGHEIRHDTQNHHVKNTALRVLFPFALHALTQLATTNRSGAPTIGRSLLRILQGYAILMTSELVGHFWYSRQCERDADAALKDSPLLAKAFAAWLGEEHEGKYQTQCIELWNSVHRDKKDIGLISTVIAKNMSQADYVQFQKNYGILDATHPWPSERIAYLEQWANEQSK